MKGLKKTQGGARSTRESELLKLKEAHPIIEPILEYRELAKLLSTYVDVLPKLVDQGGRIHSTLVQTGAATGRMSSRDPNLQNLPAQSGFGDDIRRGFIASPGKVFVGADYSQIEMRLLAELSNDENLIEIFKSGRDVHTEVAARVFGVKAGVVTKEMRRAAKVINFGIIYGMGVNALKNNLGGTREEAQTFYNNYFASYPSIRNYFDEVVAGAKKNGYTKTLFGRRRYFPGLRSKIPFLIAAAERAAANAPIQGTATGDIIKLAIIKIDQELTKRGLADHSQFVLQVHDELIYEVDQAKAEDVKELVLEVMAKVADLRVPLSAEAAVGENISMLK
jgi:DNA polymerase-1